MSAVSMETSLPSTPMAMPTFDLARAGASFTPSPTIATLPNLSLRWATSSSFFVRKKFSVITVHTNLFRESGGRRLVVPADYCGLDSSFLQFLFRHRRQNLSVVFPGNHTQ